MKYNFGFGVVLRLRHGGGECLNQDLQDLRIRRMNVFSVLCKNPENLKIQKILILTKFGWLCQLSESMLKLVVNPARQEQVANPVFSGAGFTGFED